MTLGFIAGFEHELAKDVVKCKGHSALVSTLRESTEDHVKAAAAWALGQIGRHSLELAKALAEQQALKELLVVYMAAEEKSDLKIKSKKAIRSVVSHCQEMEHLRLMLEAAPDKILKTVVAQIAIVLKSNPGAKKEFAEKGGLKKLQEIKAPAGKPLHAAITEINEMYPPEVVKHYSPGYISSLLDKVGDFQQQQNI